MEWTILREEGCMCWTVVFCQNCMCFMQSMFHFPHEIFHICGSVGEKRARVNMFVFVTYFTHVATDVFYVGLGQMW